MPISVPGQTEIEQDAGSNHDLETGNNNLDCQVGHFPTEQWDDNDDEPTPRDFILTFRELSHGEGTISMGRVVQLMSSVGIMIDEGEVPRLAKMACGVALPSLNLDQACALFKYCSDPAFREALNAANVPTPIWRRASQYLCHSSGPIAKSWRLLGVQMALCVLICLGLTVTSIILHYDGHVSLMENSMLRELQLIKASMDSILRASDQVKTLRLRGQSTILEALLEDSVPAIVSDTERRRLRQLAAVIGAMSDKAYLTYLQPLQSTLSFVATMASRLGEGDPEESTVFLQLRSDLVLSFHSVQSAFIHCANDASELPSLSLEAKDATLVGDPTAYLSILANGSISKKDAFVSCRDCTHIVLFRPLLLTKPNMNCSIGVVLGMAEIRTDLQMGAARAVAAANGLLDSGTEAVLVVQRPDDDFDFSVLTPMKNCIPALLMGAKTGICSENLKRTARLALSGSCGENYTTGYMGLPTLTVYRPLHAFHGAIIMESPEYQIGSVTLRYMSRVIDNLNSKACSNISYRIVDMSNPQSYPNLILSVQNGTAKIDSQTILSLIQGLRAGESTLYSAEHSFGVLTKVAVAIEPGESHQYFTVALLVEENTTASEVIRDQFINTFSNTLDKLTPTSEVLVGESIGQTLMLINTPRYCRSCEAADFPKSSTILTCDECVLRTTDYRGQSILAATGQAGMLGIMWKMDLSEVTNGVMKSLAKVIIACAVMLVAGVCVILVPLCLVQRNVKKCVCSSGAVEGRLRSIEDAVRQNFPLRIQRRLRRGDELICNTSENCAIAVLGVHSFHALTGTLSPTQVFRLLSFIFNVMDTLGSHYHVRKIKTVGDTYLCGSGLSGDESLNNDSAYAMLLYLSHVLSVFSEVGDQPSMADIFRVTMQPDRGKSGRGSQIMTQVGMSRGTITCGVMPGLVPTFDCWGPTVNIARTLQANSPPGCISVSMQTHVWIESHRELNKYFRCESSKSVHCKGIGSLKSFSLSCNNAPRFDSEFTDSQIDIKSSPNIFSTNFPQTTACNTPRKLQYSL